MKLKVLFIMTSVAAFIGCNSSLDGSKVVGTYKHNISRNMGGFNISAASELTIRKDGPGDYKYQMTVTTIDEMYGGVPKKSNSSGSLNSEKVENNEWRFVGGDLGERGAYIKIPEDGWTSPPTSITVSFAPGRGNVMDFVRY
jgi:hypothetical protein